MFCLANLTESAPRSWRHPRPMVWSVWKTKSPKDSHILYFYYNFIWKIFG